MWTKERIVAEIRRTAAENNGIPLSEKAFRDTLGLAKSQWRGKYWKRWSEAQAEAGVKPTVFLTRVWSDEDLCAQCASLTRELGQFPLEVDLTTAKAKNPLLPSLETFKARLGRTKRERLSAVLAYAKEHTEFEDVIAICELELSAIDANSEDSAKDEPSESGFVYLFKSGAYYKIGRSSSVGRREYEVALQMPEPVRNLHRINTDDPVGIEEYWHKRFADKRKNGEWFDLNQADVAAFRRRKFQ